MQLASGHSLRRTTWMAMNNQAGFVPNMAGHYIQNTGDEDLVFLELFVAPEFQEISLNKWLRALPQQAAIAHTI